MCSHQRDEAHGRLALRCCAITPSLEKKRFHMSTQKKMGTGATNIPLGRDNGWREFCTAGHGVVKSKRKPTRKDFKEALYKHILEINKQLIIDSASDEKLSGRQMAEAPTHNKTF